MLRDIKIIEAILFASGEDFFSWKMTKKVNDFEKIINKFKIPHGIYRKNAQFNYSFYSNKKYMIKNKLLKKVIDTSGAGDTFVSGLVVKYVQTGDIEQSIVFANECATRVVQKRGVSIT